MGTNSKIEWTETTWNPVTGCTKYSPGCQHCYAERLTRRFQGMKKQVKYVNGFKVTTHPQALREPLKLRKPQTIFVCSMSDLFHKDVPTDFIKQVFDVMVQADWHRYQVLTKRSERLRELSRELPWPPHIWAGVTIENNDYVSRTDDLRATGARVKFISAEPLIGPLPDLDYEGIDWMVVGGESGPGCRVMEEQWALDILDKCRECDVPYFFKQWGGVNKKKAGRLLQGKTYDEMPLAVSEYSQVTGMTVKETRCE